jgi:pantoate--beta-alanine ligase
MAIALARSVSELRALLGERQPAFVPTMGALHAGHAALVRRAREIAGQRGTVVVSVFVNPTQFAPSEDYTRYPRQLDHDAAISAQAGADVIFAPDVETMYPAGLERVADGFIMPPLPDVATKPRLEDAFRPTHFAGVVKVVARLFDIVRPAQAIFGEKDYQQLRVIVDMVRQQASRWPHLEIVPHPTIREAGGLALSSRNIYLKSDERERALALWQALNDGQRHPPHTAELIMRGVLEEHDLEVDYAVVRDAETLLPPGDGPGRRPLRALIAARLRQGGVRLIDNMMLS